MTVLPILVIAAAAIAASRPAAPAAQSGPTAYDFRTSQAYHDLSPAERTCLEQVQYDFVLLYGALELYCDTFGSPPERLEDLTPLILKELPRDPFVDPTAASPKPNGQYIQSLDGFGYQYRRGYERSWIIRSVGLQGFPYLAERGNIGLYLPKGTWISGMQPVPVDQ